MKRLLILIVLVCDSSVCWSQLSKGVMVTSPFRTLYSKAPKDPVLTYRNLLGIGWHKERWQTDRRFRVWDMSIGMGKGTFSAQRQRDMYKLPQMPDGEYRTFFLDATWKLGIPLFHREYDDHFFWYTTAGVGFCYKDHEGRVEYKDRSAFYFDRELIPKFLDYEIGFETRMGHDWYYNMSANIEVTYNITASISVRILKRSYKLTESVVR